MADDEDRTVEGEAMLHGGAQFGAPPQAEGGEVTQGSAESQPPANSPVFPDHEAPSDASVPSAERVDDEGRAAPGDGSARPVELRVSSSGGGGQGAGGEAPSRGVEWDPEEGGERPAPPEGWYEPYVPEEKPVNEPQPKPRGDAW